MTIQINLSELTKKLDEASKLKSKVMKKALPIFVGYTPIRTGNARSRTHLSNNTIIARYPYAQRLEEGYSKQAPNGMTAPTAKDMISIIKDLIRKGLK